MEIEHIQEAMVFSATNQEGSEQYREFVRQVQHSARIDRAEDAVKAIRITLQTLAEQLSKEHVEYLAAKLPLELSVYLRPSSFASVHANLDIFFERVTQHGAADLPQAIHHTRAVIAVLQDVLTPDEIAHLRAQLPIEFSPLFKKSRFSNGARMNS